MLYPGTPPAFSRRRRVYQAALRGAGWDRIVAAERVRQAAAGALEGAAVALRHGAGDDRVRALVDRALRRLSLVADLETRTRRPTRGGAACDGGGRWRVYGTRVAAGSDGSAEAALGRRLAEGLEPRRQD